MDDSFDELIFSGVSNSRDCNGSAMQLPLGCLTINITRYLIRPFSLCGVEVLHLAQMV